MRLVVEAGQLRAGDATAPVAAAPVSLGRGGIVPASAKREGDGATPAARLPLRSVLLRPDRVPPLALRLPWRWLRPADGWSDAPDDPAYNRPVIHPHPFRAERLWRDDPLYDIIVVLGWNDAPVIPGRGSAIFWHVARADGAPTEGCLATARDTLVSLLPRLVPGATLEVVPPA